MLTVLVNIVKLALKRNSTLMKIVTSAEMTRIEQLCVDMGISIAELMENAGAAVAGDVKALLDEMQAARVCVLVGPGNNGGDGLVAARHLHGAGFDVTVLLCAGRAESDINLKSLLDRRVPCTDVEAVVSDFNYNELFDATDLVIDAVFGTGQNRAIGGVYARVLEQLSKRRPGRTPYIVAVDAPSGLNCDTGEADPLTPQADLTVVLGLPKVGYFKEPGAGKLGRLAVADIGIPSSLSADITTELMDSKMVRAV